VDIGAPITQAQAIARVAYNQSIMCTNYKKAMQVAFIFPSPKLEINVGKYGISDFYPHFHIREDMVLHTYGFILAEIK